MNNVKKIAYLGIGIALYFILGLSVNIPLIGHIQTDLGYIAFGAWLFLFGWEATIVGVIGCLLESLIVSGWIPIGWMLGQAFIGIICGLLYKKYKNNNIMLIIITLFAVYLGIGIIKTVIEVNLYGIPFIVKFVKNNVAFLADSLPMILGVFLGRYIEPRINK